MMGLAAGAAALATGNLPRGVRALQSHDANSQPRFGGLITRERQPLNLEYPFADLREFKTPNNQFFVRTHFPIPALDRDKWTLRCTGHIQRAISLKYDELRQLPSVTVPATIECAGNSRVFLVPKAKGVLWELGGVSTAEWTGVSLSTILERAGIKEGAVEVIFKGADKGQITEEPKTPGEIHFARSLPLEKARQREVVLAYQMNGEDLSLEHGFPLRAIVPGWYGVASVKWLTSIEVTDKPFRGYWQTTEYAYWKRHSAEPVSVPITEMQIKSEIARPTRNEAVQAGALYRVFGAAWSDGTDIANVELSTDGGKNWEATRLLGHAARFAWRLWEFHWQVPKAAGKYTLVSRATDTKGRQQPASHDVDKKAYMINHTLPVEIEVR
jgi:DMSO/TMAO reductase YedYZ molybdopterin-dependent catalytic subunit